MRNVVLEIDLGAIRRNAVRLKALAGTQKFCAVVKANAYGHGAEQVALALQPVADMFAVANVEEGVRLRAAGIFKDILVFAPPLDTEEVFFAASHHLIQTVADEGGFALMARCFEKYRLPSRVHIKINTGMNRYGFSPRLTEKAFAKFLSPAFRAEGIYSHFYDSADEKAVKTQFALFCPCADRARRATQKPLVRHIAATGGVLKGKGYCLDMARCGIGLYGYLPYESGAVTLERAMKAYAFAAGGAPYQKGGCGYGADGGLTRFSAVRFGYADGLYKNSSLGVNGLCMDAYVTAKRHARGEKVLVFDDAEKAAKEAGTIPYAVLCSFSARAERNYRDDRR